MKRTSITWILLLPLFITPGCCTKKDCEGADEIYELYFVNFFAADVDTVIIKSYEQNSGFTSPVDSIIATATERGTAFVLHLNNHLNVSYDYQLSLPGIGANYYLTGFKTEKEGCGNCFPYRPQSDYFNRLSSYEVNGLRQSGEQINNYK